MKRPLRVLLFSTLYPSAARPGHGLFVETRLRELRKLGDIEVQVVAPVPWFPSSHPRFGEWAQMAATPGREVRDGLTVWHPRYFLPPRIGMRVAPLVLALGARACVARLRRDGFDFDVIDAHYYYPDGVAAALLARWFRRPFVVTARGSDINLMPQYALPRRMIRWAATRANASIGVCAALIENLRAIGVAPERLHVMRNGVDLQRFTLLPRDESRAQLGLRPDATVLLSVGRLVELKGHHLVIEALQSLPDAQLVLIGEGPERERLGALAQRLGVSERVCFAGLQPNTELARWYSAADVCVLASSSEGWANVLLESMACGTPVVATRISGTLEVVREEVAGELFEPREAAPFVAALRRLLARRPPREAVRRYAEGFGWEETSLAQRTLFERIIAEERARA